jgi:hypothetical protein
MQLFLGVDCNRIIIFLSICCCCVRITYALRKHEHDLQGHLTHLYDILKHVVGLTQQQYLVSVNQEIQNSVQQNRRDELMVSADLDGGSTQGIQFADAAVDTRRCLDSSLQRVTVAWRDRKFSFSSITSIRPQCDTSEHFTLASPLG